MRAILVGLAASLFFATTFLLNRMMDLAGGSWIWSASLRFFWMVPLMLILVAARRHLSPVLAALKADPWPWLLWSTIGFGLFYAPLCYAAESGPAWLVAGTWQVTIVAGMLLAPWLTAPGEARARLPRAGLAWSFVILVGVALMQVHEAGDLGAHELLVGVLPVVVAAFAYPLGNRQMMRHCRGRLDAFQRVLGMTLASLPFWLALSLYGLATAGLPSGGQVWQTLLVAVCSGVIATVLFFSATDAVKDQPLQLAAVEATQAGEVVFCLLGEGLLLGKPWPTGWSLGGLGLTVLGMVMHAFSARGPLDPADRVREA